MFQRLQLNGIISIKSFGSSVLKFINQSPNNFLDCQNVMGIKVVTRLQLGLRHLQEHTFKCSFQKTSNHLCSFPCTTNAPPTFYSIVTRISTIDAPFSATWTELFHTYIKLRYKFWQTYIFDNLSYCYKRNTHILEATSDCIWLTKTFNKPLFWITCFFFFHLSFSKVYEFVRL